MLYRVLRNLSAGSNRNTLILAGGTISGNRFGKKTTAILVAKGALSPVSAPPLEALPGWKLRAKKFNEAGYDAILILETDDESLAFATDYKPQSIKKWKKELMDYLQLTGTRELCGGCGDKPPPAPDFLQAAPPEEEDDLLELEETDEETETDMEVTDATNND
jgi:hypothetical protein